MTEHPARPDSTTPTQPTAPIELAGTRSRWGEPRPVPSALVDKLSSICPTSVDAHDTATASRDWWPMAMHWSLDGEVPQRAAAVCRPVTTEQVAAVVGACNQAHVAVTAAGGRSGVSGGSIPLCGGVVVDLSAMHGVVRVDATSGIVEVLPGTFGPDLEAALAPHSLTVGHFPQSFDISTVGGWVACLGSGQFSTRYGKIHRMVHGLEVVLADGRVVRTGGAPAGAAGPDLTQLFVGSEGTLGIITRVWLRAHPLPAADAKAAYTFASFAEGIEACRTIIRRGATPAVLRLYDAAEAQRSHGGDGSRTTLLVFDQSDPALVAATMAIVDEVAATIGAMGDSARVDHWLAHRNDTSALQALVRKGFLVDTMEVAAPWSRLGAVYDATCAALMSVQGARSASCHLSHSYLDGACLYFTFAAAPPTRDGWPAGQRESTYVALWDAGQRAALAAGANVSHHHGVGLNRARFMSEALGGAATVLAAMKQALDPNNILNPGKLGLPANVQPWPEAVDAAGDA